MSLGYDLFLEQHKANVAKAFYWIKENLPDLIIPFKDVDYEHQIVFGHDASKTNPDEYVPYDEYFYGGNRSYGVVQEFNKAWLLHIHRNPHHWQHWILINDDPDEGEILIDMPYNYIIEMICDWWSFSWKSGNLREIFSWYEAHKDHMSLSGYTQINVEHILDLINLRLNELEGENDENSTTS